MRLISGIGLVPADRKTDGLVLDMTIRENMTLLVGSRYYKRGVMRNREADRMAAELCERFTCGRPIRAVPWGPSVAVTSRRS